MSSLVWLKNLILDAAKTKYFWWWIAVAVIPFLIVNIFFSILPIFLYRNLQVDEVNSLDPLIILLENQYLSILVGGGVLGLLQWLILRNMFSKAYRWILATILGRGFATFFIPLFINILSDRSVWSVRQFFRHPFVDAIFPFVLYGLILGGAQTLVLRRDFLEAHWWVYAVTLGVTLNGLFVGVGGFFESSLRHASYFNTFILPYYLKLLGLFLYGFTTGLALFWLVRYKKRISS